MLSKRQTQNKTKSLPGGVGKKARQKYKSQKGSQKARARKLTFNELYSKIFRFSREVEESYKKVRKLNKMGPEAKATLDIELKKSINLRTAASLKIFDYILSRLFESKTRTFLNKISKLDSVGSVRAYAGPDKRKAKKRLETLLKEIEKTEKDAERKLANFRQGMEPYKGKPEFNKKRFLIEDHFVNSFSSIFYATDKTKRQIKTVLKEI
tara:strand:- start:6880 stop:7509 length:630 start_codon:yes stop_codon:yes gene_type:complete